MMLPTIDSWSLLDPLTVDILGWTLLHFVWQGGLMAAALAGALYGLRDHTPAVRYAVSCVALVGLFALPVGTSVFLADSVLGAGSGPAAPSVTAEQTIDPATIPPVSAAEAGASAAPSLWDRAAAWIQFALPWLVLGWALGVLLFSVRLVGGAWRVRRLRRSSTPAPALWQDRLRTLAARMDLRRSVALHVSDRVEGPVVAGWWRPAVLVPAGFLSGLPPEQVEALLLHELAHVRRHDVLVGRLQAAVETLLFFHPATWWVSRQVRQTREACCDDLAVQAGADRTVYVRALATLAERVLAAPRSAAAPAASDGSLFARIQRLLAPTDDAPEKGRWGPLVAAGLLLGAFALGIAACASQQNATESETAAPPPSRAETAPETPQPTEPEATDERAPLVVTVDDDSVRETVVVRTDESVEFDSLGPGRYLLRSNRGVVDTIEVPHPQVFHALTPQVDEEALRKSQGRVQRLWADSLERDLRARIDADSLERVLRERMDADSLERVIRTRIAPDSLERVVRERFEADSLKRRLFRMQRQADSVAQRFAGRFSDKQWRLRVGSDSAFAFEFDREDFEYNLDADSLIRRHEFRADSLHRHFERIWERESPERLREQARRLRERAEQLEERAKEMEPPTPPEAPEASEDTTGASDTSVRLFDGAGFQTALGITGGRTVSFTGRQYEKWARRAAEQIDYEELLK